MTAAVWAQSKEETWRTNVPTSLNDDTVLSQLCNCRFHQCSETLLLISSLFVLMATTGPSLGRPTPSLTSLISLLPLQKKRLFYTSCSCRYCPTAQQQLPPLPLVALDAASPQMRSRAFYTADCFHIRFVIYLFISTMLLGFFYDLIVAFIVLSC